MWLGYPKKKAPRYFIFMITQNTTDWRQQKRWLEKFCESKDEDAHICVGPKGGIYEMRISKKTGRPYRIY